MPNVSSDQLAEGNTLLTMSGPGVPPYSARGLTQSLDPIDFASQTRRTINGNLKDLSVSQFRKYKSKISGKDQLPPACAGVWPGQLVSVECISELCYATGGTFSTPERTAVAGSTRVEGDFTFYRPVLEMRVIQFSIETDEWGAQVGWSMDLEEY